MIVVNIHPGLDWNDWDRRRCICFLSRSVMNGMIAGRIAPDAMMDALERIELLASCTPEFLEANRDAILNGKD